MLEKEREGKNDTLVRKGEGRGSTLFWDTVLKRTLRQGSGLSGRPTRSEPQACRPGKARRAVP